MASMALSDGGIPVRHRVLLAASLFLSVASFGFLEPFVPLYLELSGLTRGQIGLVTGIGTGMSLLIQPLLGRLSDRWDTRRPLMFGAAIAAGSAYLLYRQAGGVIPFILLTALGINGVMYLNTAAAVLIGRIVARSARIAGSTSTGSRRGGGAAFASFRVWGSLGYVVVSLLTGLLLSSRGSSGLMTREALTPLFTYGPLLFFVLAGLTLFLPDPRREQTSPDATAPDEVLSEVLSEDTPAESRVCAHNLQRYLRAHFLYLFAWCGAGAYLSLYLKGLGATPLWITVIFAAGVMCEALVMTRVGKLSDRLGRRPLMAIAFVVMPLRLLLYIPAAMVGPAWALGVQTLHGINFGIMAAVAITFVNDLCSEHNRGATQARLAATGGLAAALGPAAGGWISQTLGLQWNFAIMAMVAAVGAAQFLWKVRESIPVTDPLHRRGPAPLRPVLRVLCIPGGWLARASRRAAAARPATAAAARPDDTTVD